MTIKRKPIHLDEASCLKAAINPLRVAVAQPLAELQMTAELGPHYSPEKIADASKRVDEFFRIVKKTNSELAVAPEYFLPKKVAQEILTDATKLRNDTLYILPMETLIFNDFKALVDRFQDDSTWNTTIAKYQKRGDMEDKWVNAALIIYIKGTQKSAFIQLKTKPARLESTKMLKGKQVFGFEGKNGGLSVAICADVNPPILNQVWREIASTKPFSLTVHCQFNRKPDFEDYYHRFWSDLLNDDDGDKRIIFSVNWCRGSKINGSTETVILGRQSNRYIRGCVMQKGHSYQKRSLTGLHLQQNTQSESPNNKWEMWYCIAQTDNVRVIDFVRPKQDSQTAQSDKTEGIRSSFFYELQAIGNYDQKTPENLATVFYDKLKSEANESTPVEGFLKDLSLCEIETFSAACNMKSVGSWLEEEVDARIPTAFILCRNSAHSCDGVNGIAACPHKGKSCYRGRRQCENESTNVAFCLDSLNKLRQQGTTLCVDVTGAYPSNTKNEKNKKHGWLFHGKGWPARNVGKEIRKILDNSNTQKGTKALDLYANGTLGTITVEDIINNPGSDIVNVLIDNKPDVFETRNLPVIHIQEMPNMLGGTNG
ncbi:MAG: hypothetical protein KKI12_14310 [Proteobacteria bacterium]|nr:hypothetical protein [Actinomycetota bacterium]MBU4259503.1 hypothetical protein [Pseudomonadota bacterium]MBU4289330.1 hypothetical protein [Pseudomonadota bacterium]MBU4414325.1 hypothetical protein [Pseudomonadota bacterium]MCG2759165.1 hypothetical protein [Desulfobacteraceae bacterium]